MNSRFSTEHAMSAKDSLTQRIKAEAEALGFFACGFAEAKPVDPATAEEFRRWLAADGCAGMEYMRSHEAVRLDPRLLLDNARSIVCVALNYTPLRRIPEEEYQIAAYAYGKDYHDIMKDMLHRLAAAAGIAAYRACCDTAPLLERYWAQQAGLGWIGRNHQLIIPHAGSMFFLGELIIAEETVWSAPARNRCGNCTACLEACPTGAIGPHGRHFDSEKCLSYQTIENRGDMAEHAARSIGNSIYGCDRCTLACPWNRFATPTACSRLAPADALLEMKSDDWHNLTVEQYRRLFKGSAVKRAKYEGLMRNIRAAKAARKAAETPARKNSDDT